MKLTIESLLNHFNKLTIDSTRAEIIESTDFLLENELPIDLSLSIAEIRRGLQGEILRRAIEEKRADIIRETIMPWRGNAWRSMDFAQAYWEASCWLRRNK